MSDLKQVKIDNWGNYFLQRLKHFFNRTDYCDLTLQFQDNAQLKVHRLVLSACTEYFELLERTCEMYEDCLIMPEDLQADVVVPIVNFMYTGQLQFKLNALERLYQTSQIMNMTVLTKLLESHRDESRSWSQQNSQPVKQYERKADKSKHTVSNNSSNKRSYSKAFPSFCTSSQKVKHDVKKRDVTHKQTPFVERNLTFHNNKARLAEPRPTRYELPEELDVDNDFSNSFRSVSYTSEPLMVHPETSKSYAAKKKKTFESGQYSETSTINLVSCSSKQSKRDSFYQDDGNESLDDETDIFDSSVKIKSERTKDTSHLFDQILDDTPSTSENLPKVTIESKESNLPSNLDHAKIISEVLKKYPHLVKSNKNIKLKILETQPKVKPHTESKSKKIKNILKDFAFQSKVLDSKEAAKLIAMGADNISGPWICLICGTPGKALHFKTYYSYRRHLVDVHNEKPISTICEYCGLKSLKRNYLVYHQYTKHDVEPPRQYKFPKCNQCNYIALTEGLLAKHKLNHAEAKSFRCNHCATKFESSSQLLVHIQNTGHKYTGDRNTNLQCIYCLKTFLREPNLYTHLKMNHKTAALDDGVIDPSEDERDDEMLTQRITKPTVKYEVPVTFENDKDRFCSQYEIQETNDGNIQVTKKRIIKNQNILNSQLKANVQGMNIANQDSDEEVVSEEPECSEKSTVKYEILDDHDKGKSKQHLNKFGRKCYSQTTTSINNYKNAEVGISSLPTITRNSPTKQNQSQERISSECLHEEIVMIDNIEYIIRDNHLIPRQMTEDEFITPEMLSSETEEPMQVITTSQPIELELNNAINQDNQSILRKSGNINQPIQIVVSSEEEYKALIASNHPILFDDGNSNKTLTMLTTPQHNTNIELNSTQSNDVVILPENFPINVSQSVSADNSNIVVVYSHSVDTHNKEQYQLIPQAMDTELVQSSAVITPNYETVTTSTSVVSAHVIETPLQHWEDNSQNSQQIEMSADLQPMNIVQQTVIVPAQHTLTDSTNVVTDAQVSTDYAQDAVAPLKSNTDNVPAEGITENASSVNVIPSTAPKQIQNESSSLMEVDNVPLDKEMSVIQLVNTAEQNKTNDVIIQSSDLAEVTESNDAAESAEPEVVVNSNGVEEIVEKHAEVTESHNNNINPQAVDTHIQSLTSDWSEDEYDSSPQTKTSPDVEKSAADVEESIENIQQEVDKQMIQVNQQTEKVAQETKESVQQSGEENQTILVQEICETDELMTGADQKASEGDHEVDQPILEEDQPVDETQQPIAEDEQLTTQNDEPITDETEESADSQEEISTVTEPVCQATEIIAGNSTPAREKISSLLNDWEENDSQDESSQKSGDEVTDSNNDNLESDTKVNDIPKSDDKIKKLVSDWDDDDEDEVSKE